jgi:surface protein
MSNVFKNLIYRCIDCKINLCPLCRNKKEHFNHTVINYNDKCFLCDEHGGACFSFCKDCLKNLCFQCEDKHANHNIVDYRTLKKKRDDLEKEIENFRQFIDKANKIIDVEIKNYIDTWNKVLDNFETVYKIKKDLLELMNNNQRNYQKLLNQNFIIKKFDNDINSIINAKNINDRFKNILNIYSKMKLKNIIIEEENKNILIMQYKINNNNIKIFGNKFVKNNKDKLKIINSNKEYELSEYFDINNNNDEILEIKLKNINNITNASYMFYGCSSLLLLPNIDNWNTINITNMSGMFCECSSLKSLPDISKWNTINITNMSGIFCRCSSLKSFPDISK